MDYDVVLKELSTYTAVSGYEKNTCQYIKSIFEKYCDSVEIDKFFNIIGHKKGTNGAKGRIMVAAHYDEIGFLVKSIDERGFIKFVNIGGIDSKILPAQEVIVHGREDIPGVIGAKPPHLLKSEEREKAVKIKDLTIDTGMEPKVLRELVQIGDPITLAAHPISLKNDKISSKSIDNRCGLAALIIAMAELQNLKHEADVVFVASTQEETELTGITTASYNLEPDTAIILDACHGEISGVSDEDAFPLGKGPAIGIGPNLHKELTKKLINKAKEENIPYQIDVEPGDTGTEAWATQVSRNGIPTVLVSIPVKYMHTPVEVTDMKDVKNAGRLIARFISEI